jgi:hypothetical protein
LHSLCRGNHKTISRNLHYLVAKFRTLDAKNCELMLRKPQLPCANIRNTGATAAPSSGCFGVLENFSNKRGSATTPTPGTHDPSTTTMKGLTMMLPNPNASSQSLTPESVT